MDQDPARDSAAGLSWAQRRAAKRRAHEAHEKARSIDRANDKRSKAENKQGRDKNQKKTDKKQKKTDKKTGRPRQGRA